MLFKTLYLPSIADRPFCVMTKHIDPTGFIEEIYFFSTKPFVTTSTKPLGSPPEPFALNNSISSDLATSCCFESFFRIFSSAGLSIEAPPVLLFKRHSYTLKQIYLYE